MIFLLKTLMLINFILILFYLIGEFFIFNKNNIMPKTKAKWGVSLGSLLFVYIILAIITALLGIMSTNSIFSILLIFASMPFLIGHLAKYKTLKFYSNFQILMFILSLSFCIYSYKLFF